MLLKDERKEKTMSILIKGLEMPQDGSRITICIYSNGSCEEPNWQWDETPLQGVQAVPVPPHGRLGDLDALREDWLENGENEYIYDTNAFLESIDSAPTIIEEEYKIENGFT